MTLRSRIFLLLIGMAVVTAGGVALLVVVTVPEDTRADALPAILGGLVLLLIVTTVSGAMVLQSLVIDPLQAMNNKLNQIGEKGGDKLPVQPDDPGELAGLASAVNAMIERLNVAQVSLGQRDTQLRSVVNRAPVILFALDKDGKFVLAEGLGLVKLDKTTEQHVGQSIYSVYADNDFLLEDIRRVLKGETFSNMVNFGDHAFDMYYTPISAAGSGVDGAICVAVNATDRIQTEEALRMAKDAAEAVSQAKSTFLANMSHELRTPLNAIIGFIGIMLMNKGLNEKDLYRAERIRANGERLLALIDEILDLSRIEAGRLHLVPQPVKIREALGDVEGRIRVLSEEKQLDFVTTVDDDLPESVEIDPDALTKVVTNLLSNAVKFTEEGKVALHVSRTPSDLVIKVTDTGIGIPSHMHEIIFEGFQQVDDSSTRQYGGTGLGLAIVHHICQVMNGTITVDSVVGEGTTFEVALPIFATVAA